MLMLQPGGLYLALALTGINQRRAMLQVQRTVAGTATHGREALDGIIWYPGPYATHITHLHTVHQSSNGHLQLGSAAAPREPGSGENGVWSIS